MNLGATTEKQSSNEERSATLSPAVVKSETTEAGQRQVPDESQSKPFFAPSSATSTKPTPESQSINNIERLRDAVHVRYLFQDFIISPSGDTSSGWLAFLLPRLYATAEHDSTLNLAVRAAAYAYIGNKRRSSELQIEAQEFYGQCLKALGADLADLELATSNSTLIAVLVLSLYEYIAGKDEQSFWHSHGHGLRTLMKLRITHPPPDIQDIPVAELPDGIILCQMQRQNLDARKPPTPEEGTFVKSLDSTLPGSRMFGAAFQCSHVVARAHERLVNSDGTAISFERLEEAVADIEAFDDQLRRLFPTFLSPSRETESRIATTLSEADVQALWMDSKPTFRAMAMWIFLKASRMILHEVHLQCLEKLQASGNKLLQSLDTIREVSEAIFAAVDYMGCANASSKQVPDDKGPRNMGGYYLLWPLHVVVECRYTSKPQKKVARDALLRIGEEMGLRHALEIAEGCQEKV